MWGGVLYVFCCMRWLAGRLQVSVRAVYVECLITLLLSFDQTAARRWCSFLQQISWRLQPTTSTPNFLCFCPCIDITGGAVPINRAAAHRNLQQEPRAHHQSQADTDAWREVRRLLQLRGGGGEVKQEAAGAQLAQYSCFRCCVAHLLLPLALMPRSRVAAAGAPATLPADLLTSVGTCLGLTPAAQQALLSAAASAPAPSFRGPAVTVVKPRIESKSRSQAAPQALGSSGFGGGAASVSFGAGAAAAAGAAGNVSLGSAAATAFGQAAAKSGSGGAGSMSLGSQSTGGASPATTMGSKPFSPAGGATGWGAGAGAGSVGPSTLPGGVGMAAPRAATAGAGAAVPDQQSWQQEEHIRRLQEQVEAAQRQAAAAAAAAGAAVQAREEQLRRQQQEAAAVLHQQQWELAQQRREVEEARFRCEGRWWGVGVEGVGRPVLLLVCWGWGGAAAAVGAGTAAEGGGGGAFQARAAVSNGT